jgi:Zinc finger, ZZ type
MSMAANFDHKYVLLGQESIIYDHLRSYVFREWRSELLVPPEAFAGSDLLQLEMESFENTAQQQKAMKTRFFPKANKTAAPTVQQASTILLTPESAESRTPTGDTVSAVDSETAVVGNWEASDELRGTAQGVSGGDVSITIVSATEASEDEEDTPSNGVLNPEGTSGLVSGQSLDFAEGAVHPGISCDGCGKPSIIGVRWKCLVCDNYDLCTDCRSSGKCTKGHSVNHRVLRIESPDSKWRF